jgi:CubicO group peptidase (beta-lactamase class C family)
MVGQRRILGCVAVLCAAVGASGCSGDDDDPAGGGTGGTSGAAGASGSAGAEACEAVLEPTGDAKFDGLAQYFADKWRAGKVPGGALVVYHEGKLRKMVFGSKRADGCAPVGLGSRFHVPRIANVATALAVIRASTGDSPILDLDKPITTWMPEFVDHFDDEKSKSRAANVTLRHLLSYTSGYSPTTWGKVDTCAEFAPPEAEQVAPESLAAFFQHARGTIVHEPGTSWMFSEPAYALTARVLELAAGQHFPRAVAERFSEPSGLGLTFDPAEAVSGDFAWIDPQFCGLLWSTWGSFVSTDDLGKLVQSIASGGGDGVLSQQEVAMELDAGMSVVAPAAQGKATLGFFRLPYPPYGTLAFRFGELAFGARGVAGGIFILPEQNFGFAYVQNQGPAPGTGWDPTSVQERLLGEYFPEFEGYDYSKDPSTWSEYAGKYQADDGSVADVAVANGSMKVTLAGGDKDGEYPVDPGGFVYWRDGTKLGDSIDEDWFALGNLKDTPNFRFYRDPNGVPVSIAPYSLALPGPFFRVP